MALERIEASDFKPDRAVLVGDVLRRWARRSGVLKASDRERVWAAWRRAAGSDAAHTALEGMRGGVLWFTVDSSAVLQELKSFRREELLEALRREVRSYFVRDIRFRLEKRRRPEAARPRRHMEQ
jgi:predicted nucleic acid-binding Zn ribbon protein